MSSAAHLLDFFRSAPLHERLLSSDAARNPALNWAIRHHTGLIVVALIVFILAWQCFIWPLCVLALPFLLTSQLLLAPATPAGPTVRPLVSLTDPASSEIAKTSRAFGQFGEIVRAEAGILQYEWARKYAANGEPCIRAVGPFGIERVIFLTPQAAQQSTSILSRDRD